METIADKHVAHNDREKPEYNLTVTELDEAVNHVKRLIRKYGRLFDGGGDGEGEPNLEDMLSFYRFAWLDEKTTA